MLLHIFGALFIVSSIRLLAATISTPLSNFWFKTSGAVTLVFGHRDNGWMLLEHAKVVHRIFTLLLLSLQ